MPHLHKTMRRLTKNQKKTFVPPSMETDFYQMPTLPAVSPSMNNRNNLNQSQQQEPSLQATIPSSPVNAEMLGGIQSQISSIIGSNSSGSNNQNALLLAAALRAGTGGNGIGNNNDNNNSITLGAGKIFDRQESSSFPNMSSMGNILDFQNLTNSMPNSISLLLQSLQYQRRQQEQLQQLQQIQSLISQNNSGPISNFLLNQTMNNSQTNPQPSTNATNMFMKNTNSLESGMQSNGNPVPSLSSSMLLQNQLLNNVISNRNGAHYSGTQFGQSDARIQQNSRGDLELLLQRLSSSSGANQSQDMSNERTDYAYASSLSFSNNSSRSGDIADETSSSSISS